jgi:hypothetical protein
MRGVVFRILAGLLAVAFIAVVAFGDTSKMSLPELVGIGAIGTGFGLYALLGSDPGERFIFAAFGGRDPARGGRPIAGKHTETDTRPDRRRI